MRKYLLISVIAFFCLGLMGEKNMDKEKTDIGLEFFTAVSGSGTVKNLTDEKIIPFYLDMEKMMAGTITDAIPLFFDKKIKNLQSQATCDNILYLKNMDGFRWMIFDYLIKLSIKDSLGDNEKLNLEFLDLAKNTTLNQDIEIDKEKVTLVVVKKKEKLVILAFRPRTEKGNYSSVFYFEDVIIYSENQSWNYNVMDKPLAVFPRAKAVLTRLNPRIALVGEKITYDRANNQLVGEKAKIFAQDGGQLGAGDKIVVLVKNPDKYEIK